MINLKPVGKRWYQFESDIDKRLEKAISKKLSYIKAGSEFMAHPEWGIVKLYNSKKRAFPSGLLYLVKPILESWKKKFGEDYSIVINECIKMLPIELVGLRPYQKEAVEAIKKNLVPNSGSQVVAAVGSGKTKIGERIIAGIPDEKKVLILSPTTEICNQWKREVKYLDNGILAKCSESYSMDIMTYQKAYSNLKKETSYLKKYDFVIVDESQRVAANTFYKVGLACTNAHIVGLTGTPKRADGADLKIQAITGPIIYTAGIEDLTKKGFLTPVRVNIITIPKFKVSTEMDYRDIYNGGIVNHTYRNREIVKIAKAKYKEGPVLILFDNIEHGKILLYRLKKNDLNPAYIDGNTKDRDKILEDIKANKYDLILASRVYNEGINIPELKTLIIASGGKSPTRIIQQIGRVVRKHKSKDVAEVYDFADKCRSLGKHFKERLNLYEENGFEVKYE